MILSLKRASPYLKAFTENIIMGDVSYGNGTWLEVRKNKARARASWFWNIFRWPSDESHGPSVRAPSWTIPNDDSVTLQQDTLPHGGGNDGRIRTDTTGCDTKFKGKPDPVTFVRVLILSYSIATDWSRGATVWWSYLTRLLQSECKYWIHKVRQWKGNRDEH